MNKKFLSVLLAASILCSSSVFANPEAIPTIDTAIEQNEYIEEGTAGLDNVSNEPFAIEDADTATEQNTDFATPEQSDYAFLQAALEGEGTAENPYLISNESDLFLFASNINSGIGNNAHYKLTASIDLGGKEWTPIGFYKSSAAMPTTTFCGVFDGNGYTISNYKITAATTYHIGFFVYLYEATVKNLTLDSASIDITTTTIQSLYVGSLAGRIVTLAEGKKASVENCNITNSSIKVSSGARVYTGGLTGSIISGKGQGSEINVLFCQIDCDINATSTFKSNAAASVNYVMAGGVCGYIGAEANAASRVLNCTSFGNVTVDVTDNGYVYPLAGGMFGNISATKEVGGEIYISSCQSHGDVTTNGKLICYAGGFAGQAVLIKSTKIINCYSTADVTASCPLSQQFSDKYTLVGGFVSIISYPGFNNTTDSDNTFINCFATGNAIDTGYTTESRDKSSYAGSFVAYTGAGVFKNCYKFSFQKVAGSVVDNSIITLLDENTAIDMVSYKDFDFARIWQMGNEHPVLREKNIYVTYSNGNAIFAIDTVSSGEKLTPPEAKPTKAPDIDKVYNFTYWSLIPDGPAFEFTTPINETITLYAVYTTAPRHYTVTFETEDKSYSQKVSVAYGERVTFPSVLPTKPDQGKYYYEFSYWSDVPSGNQFDFGNYTVEGDVTFIAVFKEFDKTAWTGDIADSFDSGYGTAEMPYIIATSSQFALFTKVINDGDSNYKGAYFALSDDINLGGKHWSPIGNDTAPFNAHFDGNGFSVFNFELSGDNHIGLFGYVTGGSIKNLYVSNFKIDITVDTKEEKYNLYAGGLAGVVDASEANVEISNIRVSASMFEIDGNANYVYAGGLVGYGRSKLSKKLDINNSFATNDISASTDSYTYVGGIAGRFELAGSSCKSLISNCYYTGNLSAVSKNSCYAGGLVGYMFSSGSGYMSTGSNTGMLNADDPDLMIENCFVVANVTANSTGTTGVNYTNIGQIVGAMSQYATVSTVYYASSNVLSSTSGNVKEFVCTMLDTNPAVILETEVGRAAFTKQTALENDLMFDFENTWVFVAGNEFPTLKCISAAKPGLRFTEVSLKNGVLNAKFQVYFKQSNYTVIACVYNAQNRMIKLERISFEDDGELKEKTVNYSGMENAHRVSLYAIENGSFKPISKTENWDL